MAGELSRLLLRPEACRLEGLNVQAYMSNRHPGRLYAALYFDRITQTVPDDTYHALWDCTDCICHISLAADHELPEYNGRLQQRLIQPMRKWQRSHSSVEVSLVYLDLDRRLHPYKTHCFEYNRRRRITPSSTLAHVA